MKSIDKERIEFLQNELKEYEKITPMTEDERENYIAKLNGVDTIDNLCEDLDQELFRTSIYEKVLSSHGLLEEANQLFHKRIEESNIFMSEWIKNHPVEELPFD